jgi:ATP-dependent Clp protease ATP-binding subunit ClpC
MRYSIRARSVIRFANQEAARLDHDHISTGHLLLGLIREGEGAAIDFLRENSVDLDKIKAELEDKMANNKGRGSRIVEIQLTKGAKSVLEMAVEESANMGHKYVGTEHLLVALIRKRDAVASKVLARNNVALDAARAAAQDNISDEEEPIETLTFDNVKMTVPIQEYGTGYSAAVPEKEVLDLNEASELLGITANNLKELLKAEDLPARMINGQWRFSRSALIRWLGEGSSQNYTKSKET